MEISKKMVITSWLKLVFYTILILKKITLKSKDYKTAAGRCRRTFFRDSIGGLEFIKYLI